MKKLFLLLSWLVLAHAQAQVCAPPSSLGTGPTAGIVNNYYQSNGNLSTGATSLVLGTLGPGATATVAVGDLFVVMQMQDGTFNNSNNSSYGDGSGSGSGSTSVGQAGLHEFVRITAVSGSNVTFTPALTNNYIQAAATATTAQKTYQVVRVQQYSSLTATGLTAPRWNGLTGGVIVVDVQGLLTLGSGTVEGQTGRAFFLAGKGFRGGGGRQLNASAGNSNDYTIASTFNVDGSKAEGIMGTPYYAANLTSNWGFKTTNPPAITIPAVTPTIEGYPGGSMARGAPGNAGGGGTDGTGNVNQENAGGGGGGNYGPGGIGGRPWNSPLKDTGGRGGASYAGTLAFNRIFMGGGGGAGGSNNGTADPVAYTNQGIGCSLGAALCSSGAPGGGIVLIRAKSITGSGVIDVRGGHGYNVVNDAGGGGGAGGSVVIYTIDGGNATVDATGGDGGNANGSAVGGLPERHGPGGAGGGGFVAFSPTSLAITANLNGGAPGKTMSDIAPDESYGSTGFNGGLNAFQIPNTPGAPPAALCNSSLSLVKSNGVNILTSPATTTYTLTVQNSGLSASAGTVTVADKLPAGLSVVTGTLTLSGANAANWSCTAFNTTDIVCNSTATIAGSGGSSSFGIAVNVTAPNNSAVINRAQVSGGGDPNKPLPANTTTAVASAALCSANNTPAGCAIDTDSVLAPILGLTKTNGTTTLVTGATSVYTLSVSNLGNAPTTGTITVVDVLPTGLTYSGTSPFTVNNFICTVAAPTITCNRATTLAASTQTTINFTVTVNANAPTSVINRAKVGGGGDPSPLKSTPTSTSTLACPAPTAPASVFSETSTGCASDIDSTTYVSINLTKDDGQVFVSQNGSTEYVFTVQNIGTAPTRGTISFRDVLPGTMSMPGAIGTPFTPTGLNGGNWSCVRNTSTDISCTSITSIPAGRASIFSLAVNIGNAAAGTEQRNKARVGGGGDITPGKVATPTNADVLACINDDNPLGCAIDINVVQTAPEIRMSKSHPNPQSRSPGGTFAFSLVLSNNGGVSATTSTVSMLDITPAGLSVTAVASTAPFVCSVATIALGQAVTCNNTGGVFPPNSTRLVTITVVVQTTATNNLVNRARIAGTEDPQNGVLPTTATAATSTVICNGQDVPALGCAVDSVPLNADMQITKLQRLGVAGIFTSALVGAPLGTTVQYQITVSNVGPSRVTAAQITDNVPANLSTVTWTCNATGTASCGTASGTGNNISLTGTMAPASTLTVLVTGVATASTGLTGVTNTAIVTAPVGINDSTPGNNSSSVATAIGATNLSISKTNSTSTVAAGGTTSYTIVVTNSGPTAANGARLFDPVAPGLSCTAAPSCAAAGPATSCPVGLSMAQLQNTTVPTGVTIPTLGAGGSVTVTVVCRVTATGQ
jgi:uncharacterized repeat protein (TIGR01451 family)